MLQRTWVLMYLTFSLICTNLGPEVLLHDNEVPKKQNTRYEWKLIQKENYFLFLT